MFCRRKKPSSTNDGRVLKAVPNLKLTAKAPGNGIFGRLVKFPFGVSFMAGAFPAASFREGNIFGSILGIPARWGGPPTIVIDEVK